MQQLWWDKLRQAKKSINANPRLTFEGGLPPITGTNKSDIQKDILWYLDHLIEHDEGTWRIGLDPEIAEWYMRTKANEGKGFWPWWRGDMTEALIKLNNYNATKMFWVYRDHANNGNTANRLGLNPGETCVGAKTVARKAKVNEGYLHRGNGILEEAGLVVFVRRMWFNGPYVRWVARDVDEIRRAKDLRPGDDEKKEEAIARMPYLPAPVSLKA
jgi:hypothetical protein